MKISIITACFNSADTIMSALVSINDQTYSNVEYIIVDGNSTDNTLDIVRMHGTRITKIISESDDGIYDALNKGCLLSSGDVIGILHSDDYYADQNILSDVAVAFEDPLIDIVYGDLDYVRKFNTNSILRKWRSGEFKFHKLALGWMPPHPTMFVRRSIFDKHGIYDTTYKIAADYDFMLRILSQGNVKIKYLPRVLVKMRLGGVSNRSIRGVYQKSKEDYFALRKNNVGGLKALFFKNIRKIPQFISSRFFLGDDEL